MVEGEPLQILYNSNFSGLEAWRKLSKRYSPTTPMRGMQLLLATFNQGKAKKLDETIGFIDKWETKVLALSRDFNEKLSDQMKAAIVISIFPQDQQDVQQADNITDFKTITIVEAKMALKDPGMMDCDLVSSHALNQGADTKHSLRRVHSRV